MDIGAVVKELAPLAVAGVPVAVAIYVIVEALLFAGLVKNATDSKRRATVIVGVVLAGVYTARVLADAPVVTTALVIDTAFVALVSCLAAALLHEVVSAGVHLARGEPLHPPGL